MDKSIKLKTIIRDVFRMAFTVIGVILVAILVAGLALDHYVTELIKEPESD